MKETKKITKSARATKVNISINDELLERADSFCEKNYLSRSGLISLSLSQYLIAQEVNNLLRNMTISMQKIADKIKVSLSIIATVFLREGLSCIP